MKVLPPAFASHPDRMGRFERKRVCSPRCSISNIAVLHGLEESGNLRAPIGQPKALFEAATDGFDPAPGGQRF